MSILNKMLKDIEQRHEIKSEQPQPANVIEIVDTVAIRNKILVVVLVLLLVYVAMLVWPYVSTNKVSTPLILSNPSSTFAKNDVETVKLEVESNQNTIKPSSQQMKVQTQDSAIARGEIEQEVKQPEQSNNKNQIDIASNDVVEPDRVSVNSADSVVAISDRQQKTKKEQSSQSIPESGQTMNSQTYAMTLEQQAELSFSQSKKSFNFGLIDEAIAGFNSVIEIMPKHKEARSLLAAAYYGRNDIKIATDVLQDGLEIYPELIRWRILLARISIEQKNYNRVLSVLASEYETKATRDFWILKGTAAQQIENYALTIHCFEKLTVLEPGQAKWWLAIATAYDAMAEYALAKRFYITASQVGGLSPNARQHTKVRLQYIRGVI